MVTVRISRVRFSNIRNFDVYDEHFQGPIIFIGDNGVGKTTILEAISLVYGRGIRSANYDEILNYNSKDKNWSSFIQIQNEYSSNQIFAEYKNNKKTLKINGKSVKNFNEIIEYIRIFWVTQSDYHKLLISNSYRRTFLDRIISQFIPNYYNHLLQYKRYLDERNKILLNSTHDAIWLDGIEKKLSNLSILIRDARNDVVEKINLLNSGVFDPYVTVHGTFEDKNFSEEEFSLFLKQNRLFHSQIKRCNIGIHLSKIEISNRDNKSIDFLSSGEQRLLLNQLMINFIKIQNEEDRSKSVMLLDDILTFFDTKNQNLLVKKLLDLNIQFFITTNSLQLEKEIAEQIQIIKIEAEEFVVY